MPRPGTRAAAYDRDLAAQWRRVVCRGSRCFVCGRRGRVEGHHVPAQADLRHEYPHGAVVISGALIPCTRGSAPDVTLAEIVWNPAFGVPLCEPCHDGHESGVKPLRVAALPITTRAELRRLTPALNARLEREYQS